jgi:hypothetical protein
MLSETVVSTLLLASIGGAGLILALYALIIPISDKIFERRAEKLKSLVEEFEKEKIKITTEASKTDSERERLKDSLNEFEAVEDFPRKLVLGIVFTFSLFSSSAYSDAFLLFTPRANIVSDYITEIFFIIAILSFLVVSFYAIFEINMYMENEAHETLDKSRELLRKYKVVEI